MPPYRRVAIVLLWKYCHSHSFSRVNFQACALILPLCQQNVESAEQICKGMRIWIAPAPPSIPHPYRQSRNIFDGDAIRDSPFTKCPPSEYSVPNGIVHHSGFTDDNNLTCTFNIRVPVSRRVVLEIKKHKVMGRMPNCENGSLEIRVG